MQVATEQGRCVDVRWHRRKDGSRVYMTGVLKGLRDEEGTLLGYSKVFLDDTARRRGPTMICSSLPMWPATTCRSPCGRCPALPTFSQAALQRETRRGGSELPGIQIDASKRMGVLISDYSPFHNWSTQRAGGRSGFIWTMRRVLRRQNKRAFLERAFKAGRAIKRHGGSISISLTACPTVARNASKLDSF